MLSINLGTAFQSLGKYTTAKEHFVNAIAIILAKEIVDRENKAPCLAKLRTFFHSVGDYSKAKEYLKTAIAIKEEIGDNKNEALYHGQLGRVGCFSPSLNMPRQRNVTKKHFQSQKNCATRKASQLSTPTWDGWGICKHWRILRQSTCYHKRAWATEELKPRVTSNRKYLSFCLPICQG